MYTNLGLHKNVGIDLFEIMPTIACRKRAGTYMLLLV